MKVKTIWEALSTISVMLLLVNITARGQENIGTRIPSLPTAAWEASQWISVVDAPIAKGRADQILRAANGSNWFVFTLRNEQKVKSAKWMTTGLGVYDLYLNGQRIGEEILKPGFTHYEKTKRSFTYDITDAFIKKKGKENILSAQVTPGWWADKIITPGDYDGMVGKKCAFRAVLELTFSDGTKKLYGTDCNHWKAGIAGPITHAGIFDGEEYDARLLPGHDCIEKLSKPEINTEFKGEILASDGAEVYLRKDLTLHPVETYIWEGVTGAKSSEKKEEIEYGKVIVKRTYSSNQPITLKAGETLIVDFGQNCSAVPSFVFKAKEGTQLSCLPGEILNDGNGAERRGMDGPEGSIHRRNLRADKDCFRVYYTFGNNNDFVTYTPHTTFFGYRYVSITANDEVTIRQITSIPVSSIAQHLDAGKIITGNASINQLISNTIWGQRSNYLSVPTDCPQRDERLGWTADTQVFAETGTYFANTKKFFHKWMRDLRDTQGEHGGFPGVAPKAEYGSEPNAMMRLGWSDAGIIVPWTIWKQYNDKEIIEDNWEAMDRFIQHVNDTKYCHDSLHAENGNYQWADWLSYEALESCINLAFKDEQSRKDAAHYWNFLGASYWAIDAGMMRDMAIASGRDATPYEKMVTNARKYLKENFINDNGDFKNEVLNTMQTPALFALKNKLVEGTAREQLIARLKQNFADHGNCLQTGFLGTSILMPTLTENGMVDIAYDLLFQRKDPSWLYSIDNGATTIWERWNSYTKERGLGPVGMNSFNHYAYGAVCAWIWKTVAGIAADTSAPGFRHIIMQPIPDKRLGFVSAEYPSAAGVIKSAWRYEGDNWIWEFTIPEGATASVRLPHENVTKEYGSGKHLIVKDMGLKSSFLNPPQEARPRVWWHWMNGNITEDGIRKDIAWMNRIGIGGFHCFDAGLDTDAIVEKRLPYMSNEWKKAFSKAITLADSLNMEVAIASCPGWSNTGGPWVKPEQAMKKLVWRQIRVNGGKQLKLTLPSPYTNAGSYQNFPSGKQIDWYKDTYVIAARLKKNDKTQKELLGKYSTSQLDNSPTWIQYEFQKPQTIKALSIIDGHVRPIWAAAPAPVTKYLEASNDGKNFHKVCDIPHGGIFRQTIGINSTTAKFFRVVFTKKPTITPQLFLHTVSRINHAEEKAGFATPSDLMQHPTIASTEDAITLSDIIDITDKVDDNGTLTWDAPEGNWMIFRFGYSLTGKENHPASREATGLEVSKIDKEAFSEFLEHYIKMYKEVTNQMIGQRGVNYLLIDSYEAGWETWAPNIAEEFEKRRGYNLIKWMPVLTGIIVESVEQSEKFLFDWRTTIGELIQECMYENAAEIAHRHGMETYFEAHENGRLYLADGMSVKSASDIPMAAMWTIITDKKLDNSSVMMAESDIRESASVAHLYGKKIVAVESMTVNGLAGGAYSYHPGNLKATADMEMACGANRFVIHESAHQPVDDKRPGLGLGIYGQWFNRHETWAEQAKVWTDYLARSSFMLQQGKNVADILYYYGEDDVITSLFAHQHPQIPFGYNYDYLNKKALLDLISFDGKQYTTPSGNQYRLLVISKHCQHFSPDVKQKLQDLKEAGAPIIDERIESISKILTQFNRDFYTDDTCNIRYVHRQLADKDIYWVNNRNHTPRQLNAIFRVNGKKPSLWHPDTGIIEDLAYEMKDGKTHVQLPLSENDAVFVVFQETTTITKQSLPEYEENLFRRIDTPWTVCFDERWGGPKETIFPKLMSYTESKEEGIKYYSGTATYKNRFTMDKSELQQNQYLLDLGDVACMAEVFVNGKSMGTLWKSPYKTDITDALKHGMNELEIRVTNTWVNRLIGDEQPNNKQRYTYTSVKFYHAEDPLLPAGLIGPVNIKVLKMKNKS